MTDYVTFNSVTVPTHHLDKLTLGDAFEAVFSCRTGTYGDILALQALAPSSITMDRVSGGKTRITALGGTKATLVINGISYSNCYIAEISGITEAPNSLPFDEYEFTIRFVQETYSAS